MFIPAQRILEGRDQRAEWRDRKCDDGHHAIYHAYNGCYRDVLHE